MKAASTLIQVFALTACFAVQAQGGEFKMAGVRRAMQTMAAAGPSAQLLLPDDSVATEDAA